MLFSCAGLYQAAAAEEFRKEKWVLIATVAQIKKIKSMSAVHPVVEKNGASLIDMNHIILLLFEKTDKFKQSVFYVFMFQSWNSIRFILGFLLKTVF